jgi:hypothetical protein
MSNAANEQQPRPYSPWSQYEPPADLPDDLKAIFRRAKNPILMGESFGLHPNRFSYSVEQLSSWFEPLQRARNELAIWLIDHEAELRAKAPEALLALQKIFGPVEVFVATLGSLIGSLDPHPADPNDARLVAWVNVIRENSTPGPKRVYRQAMISVLADPDWEELLGPHRWKCVRQKGNDRFWRRPGKEVGGARQQVSAPARMGESYLPYLAATPHRSSRRTRRVAARTTSSLSMPN